jgi:hypothetical protein
MPMIIKIFASWCSSEDAKKEFEKITLSHMIPYYGKDKEIYITNNDDYTHVVIMNTAMPILKSDIPKTNVIGLAHEPLVFLGLTPQFIEYARQNIGKYYIGEKGDLPEPFVEGNTYLWYYSPYPSIPMKYNLMSIMVSQKGFAPGHKYRHHLVSKILQTKLPIDIYGRGCFVYKNTGDFRLKGNFNDVEPYKSYQFHICIENYQTPHYFSEKIINPLLAGTTPVYWGCKNINNYFENVIFLSGNAESDIKLLENIVLNPEKYKQPIDVSKIENKVNLIKNIKDMY